MRGLGARAVVSTWSEPLKLALVNVMVLANAAHAPAIEVYEKLDEYGRMDGK
jgi:hypothetical protein